MLLNRRFGVRKFYPVHLTVYFSFNICKDGVVRLLNVNNTLRKIVFHILKNNTCVRERYFFKGYLLAIILVTNIGYVP